MAIALVNVFAFGLGWFASRLDLRQLRIENVVLIGIYPQNGLEDAENSLRELAALA